MFYRGMRAGGRAAGAATACVLAGLIAVTACSSGGGQPSWVSSLGSGVTVSPPGSATAGNGSPGAVMMGIVTSLESRHPTDFCKYQEPAAQSQCDAGMSHVTSAGAASILPTFKNIKVGYTAIDGTRGLVGITGTLCVPSGKPKCFTNNDPAAKFDSGKSFATLWSQALKAPANAYSLSLVIQISGKWYSYSSGS